MQAREVLKSLKRSIHDAIMVVKRSMASKAVVAGGGAVEMEVSKYLFEESLKIEGKGQLIMAAFAKALEIRERDVNVSRNEDKNRFVLRPFV
jgi:T-complex protein 1 subunit eta